jgi:pimeloyl-ACP methyl ester carboxylesterase
MSTAPARLAPRARANLLPVDRRIRQLLWLLGACAGGFLVPYVLADRLDLTRDGYYAIHASAVAALFVAWARSSQLPIRAMVRRNLRWALLLGAAAGAALAAIVVTFDATSRPDGLRFAGALLWRGIVYGAADGLLLGAFPVLAVFAAFPYMRGRRLRTLGTGSLALVAALAVTVSYHLGYSDFRGSKVTDPMRGTAIWTAPTLLTLNPLGSVVAHASQHVAAVAHSYAGDTYLPPHAAAAPAIALRPCTIGAARAQCGTLTVAENPSQPDGAKIDLAVAVVEARSDDPEPDPLVWFAGWGSAGVADDAAGVLSAFWEVNRDRDLVFVDQRGTGSSELVCDLPPTPSPAGAALERLTAAARRCTERIGPNFRYYTSAVAVDDVDRVREALGYERINIYGGSYGATTGQIYLLRHGSRVRTAVFDSGSLLDVRIFERQPRAKQRVLDRLLDRCAADSACNTAYPGLRREYEQLLARLARSPIPVPGTAQLLDQAAFASVLDELVAYTPGKAAAPRLVHLVATGQIARVAAEQPPAQPDAGQLAYQLLIQCNEPWASWRPGEVTRNAAGTDVAPMYRRIAATMRAICAGMPEADVPAAIGERVRSDVPVLFLSGAEDGADPPANVANARRELPNSRTIVFPAAGHGQLGLPCAQSLVARFVERGTAEGLDVACARTAAVQPFVTRR